MNTRSRLVRSIGSLGAMTVLALLLVLPASATPAGEDGEHTVTICHVTESAGNPYVLVTVDEAAFDGYGNNDHRRHAAKDGRIDVLAEAGACPVVGGTTTTVTTDPGGNT